MKTIEIKVPELGNAVGTTKWVSEKLEHISKTLQVGKTKDNKPCLTYEHWEHKSNNVPKRYVLCFISNYRHVDSYEKVYEDVWCVYSQMDDYGYIVGLFNVLTEKANQIVEEFLRNICVEFHNEYNKL